MRTKAVVLILLVLVMASLVSSSASARTFGEILFGSDPKGNQAPFNELSMGLFYRDTVEPCPFPEMMVYHLMDKDGVNAVIPDETMPVPVTNRHIFAVAAGTIMTGQKIGRIIPAASTKYITIIVPSFNGWEDQGEWLYDAIKQARVAAGLDCDFTKLPIQDRAKARQLARLEARQRGEESRSDPGAFPPFICIPEECQPRTQPDGSITFGRPPMMLPVMIVSTVSNMIVGAPQSIALFVSVNRNSYSGAVIGFKTARPETFQVPNPEIARARTQPAEPPLARERVRSVTPPAAPLVQSRELPNITSNNTAPPPINQSAPNYSVSGIPWQVEKWLYGFFACTRNQRWDVPCVFPMLTSDDHNNGSLLIYGIKQNGELFSEGVATILMNGQLVGGAAYCFPLRSVDSQQGIYNRKDSMSYLYVSPNSPFHVEIHRYSNGNMDPQILGTLDGVTGPAGTITTAPVRLGY